jgi:hypothetical protein
MLMSSLYEIYFNVVLESITAKYPELKGRLADAGRVPVKPYREIAINFQAGKCLRDRSGSLQKTILDALPRKAWSRWRMVGKVRDTILISPARSLIMN